MNVWNCLTCGTQNEDPLDVAMRSLSSGMQFGKSPLTDYIDDLVKSRRKLEEKGEIYIEKCSRCSEKRV